MAWVGRDFVALNDRDLPAVSSDLNSARSLHGSIRIKVLLARSDRGL